MNRGRVGEERGGKEMDGCPLTSILNQLCRNVMKFRILITWNHGLSHLTRCFINFTKHVLMSTSCKTGFTMCMSV
jgi:hypothetical protein